MLDQLIKKTLPTYFKQTRFVPLLLFQAFGRNNFFRKMGKDVYMQYPVSL
jgi:hypothetical protein